MNNRCAFIGSMVLALILLPWLHVRADDPCEEKGDGDRPLVDLYEMRAPSRRGQHLNRVDGLNVNRDIEVTFCRQELLKLKLFGSQDLEGTVRVWLDSEQFGWQEITLQDASAEDVLKRKRTMEPEEWTAPEPVVVVILRSANSNPVVILSLKRRSLKVNQRVRIVVGVSPKRETEPRQAQGESQGGGAQGQKILDHTLTVGQFGLRASFSDALLLVQRLGEDTANRNPDNIVLFDIVNYRPAVSVNYGFNYYHRRFGFLQYLEPGFGANIALMSWNDKLKRDLADPVGGTLTGTPVQVGVGLMGSIFDNTVIGVLGWNLHVKDNRTYVGVGVSVTGLIRKLPKLVR